MIDTPAIHNLEFSLFEWRRNLVFNDFHPGFVADNFIAIFYRAYAAYIQPYGGVEFQRVTTGGGFGGAKHHAYLHTNLVDKDNQAVAALD